MVVPINEVSVRLWGKHGFSIAGTLPGAFLHATHGYVDVYVMSKVLVYANAPRIASITPL